MLGFPNPKELPKPDFLNPVRTKHTLRVCTRPLISQILSLYLECKVCSHHHVSELEQQQWSPHSSVPISSTRPHASPPRSNSPSLSQRSNNHHLNHSQKSPNPNPSSLIQTLILPFPADPSIPPGVENVKNIGNHGNIPIISALSKLQQPIIHWFKSHHNPPVAILSDSFLGWTHQLANYLGIPRIVFYSSGAFVIAAFEYLWAHYEDIKHGSSVDFADLPRSPSFSWDELPSSTFRRCKDLECNDKIGAELIKKSMLANGLSWASVFNTFWALEDEFLGYYTEVMGRPRVYSVGPLNIMGGSGKGDEIGKCDSINVMSWLDEWDDGSVLYVCFGSQKFMKKAQMEALAVGLERSGIRFVWVVKNLSAQQLADGYGSVPDGFEDRVSGRGFVLKGWAPQRAILSHRAVGGFLSHCGWNSVLEAVGAGVMILGWPMEADQFGNAKLLVEYEGAAVQLCEGGDTVPDSHELAWKITESMHGGEAKEKKAKAKELRNRALEAVKVGGSSQTDLDGLVQQISQLKLKN